ncbi:MAG TPA: response regulator transcription factor [Actinomycetota bacterium]|nr:response regulator transcription factor [Actinomycetota bacterium]
MDPIRVLVVDDHQMFADALELLLSAHPRLEPIGVTASAEQALEICDGNCPDVVLMDVDLPGMDGIEGTRRVRQRCPDTHVVIITALQPTEVLAGAVEAGASGFVPKTQAADQLAEVIQRAAAGEMVLPEGDIVSILRRLQEARQTRTDVERLVSSLTDREIEILQGLAEGKSTPELAEALFISPHTVHSHVRSILAKLGVRSKLEAVLFALRQRIIRLPGG